MPCKPGVAGSIPGFSIKPLSVSLRVLPSYNKHTNTTQGKPQKVCFFLLLLLVKETVLHGKKNLTGAVSKAVNHSMHPVPVPPSSRHTYLIFSARA